MARGGKRSGTPGKAYPARTDLNTPKIQMPSTVPGQQYGKQAEQAAAMKTVPSGPPPGPPQAGAESPQPTSQAGAGGAYLRPTENPEEPLTAGIRSGPGAGPTPSAPLRPGDDVLPQLQAMYAAFPSEGLREMIEDIVSGNG